MRCLYCGKEVSFITENGVCNRCEDKHFNSLQKDKTRSDCEKENKHHLKAGRCVLCGGYRTDLDVNNLCESCSAISGYNINDEVIDVLPLSTNSNNSMNNDNISVEVNENNSASIKNDKANINKSKQRYSTFSVVSFIFGLLSVLVYWILPFLPTCALICGIFGIKRINLETEKGKSLAIAGIVLGILYNIQIIIKLLVFGAL